MERHEGTSRVTAGDAESPLHDIPHPADSAPKDQKKIPVPEVMKTQPPPLEEAKAKRNTTKSDSTSASKRIKSQPPPGRKRAR